MPSQTTHTFSQLYIDQLLAAPEVAAARATIDAKSEGKVTFHVPLGPELRSYIHEVFGVAAPNAVPMTWIKGDTRPHIDTGAVQFETTHLAYLTDSPGEFIIDGAEYPIRRGCAYSFSEGLMHETTGTGLEPRLLLGPMSEAALAVGVPPTIYIRQVGATYQESNDQETWSDITSWPYNAYSSIEFVTDISFTSADNYFKMGSSYSYIGSLSLNNDGTRRIITIDGVIDYPGLIQNGTDLENGYGFTGVFNIEVRAVNGSTLYVSEGPGSGWVCQQYFGKAAPGNYVINCASDGPINALCGGIVGPYSATGSGAELVIVGCSSSGAIDSNGGGIIGLSAGSNSGNVTCGGCWSTGAINGDSAGGIVGNAAGADLGTITILRCYSEGIIAGEGAGGIIGGNAGQNGDGAGVITITGCYSRGNITGSYCGGIMGGYCSGTATITNCYSSGNMTGGNCGGISGATESGTIDISHSYTCGSVEGSTGYIMGFVSEVNGPAGLGWTLSNNYSEAANSGFGWNAVNAKSVLQDIPAGSNKVGDMWVETSTGAPLELNIGYTPYSKNIIGQGAFITEYSETIEAGESSIPALIGGRSYTILQKAGGDAASYNTITINSTTGAITTSANTMAGTYVLHIRNTGSYYISSVILEVTGGTPVTETACCEEPLYLNNLEYTEMNDVLSGNVLIGNKAYIRYPISYTDLMNMRKAYIYRR